MSPFAKMVVWVFPSWGMPISPPNVSQWRNAAIGLLPQTLMDTAAPNGNLVGATWYGFAKTKCNRFRSMIGLIARRRVMDYRAISGTIIMGGTFVIIGRIPMGAIAPAARAVGIPPLKNSGLPTGSASMAIVLNTGGLWSGIGISNKIAASRRKKQPRNRNNPASTNVGFNAVFSLRQESI